MDTFLRWVIIVLGFLSAGAGMWAAFMERRPRGERLGMVGSALVCLFVATGTFGLMFHYDTVWRLPFMAAALMYVFLGRTAQNIKHRKDKRR